MEQTNKRPLVILTGPTAVGKTAASIGLAKAIGGEIISEYQVTEIVLGYPKNMNNTVGERAEKSLEFKEMLEKRTGLPVVMWDERLTTMAADRTLEETGVHKEDRKQYLDQVAAVFILQGYLDAAAYRREQQEGVEE